MNIGGAIFFNFLNLRIYAFSIILLLLPFAEILLGSPLTSTSANIHGQFIYQAYLIPADGGTEDAFGYSIAIDGNRVVSGAPWHDQDLATYQGAAYVFERQGTDWVQQAKLVADDGGNSDFFGDAVAIEGDTVVVGAPYNSHSTSNHQEGSAYIFTRNGSSWNQMAKLTATDAQRRADFGRTAVIDSDTVVIGADEHTVGDNISQGKVYVFRGCGSSWAQEADLTLDTESYFGTAIAIHGDTLVVGAYLHDVGVNNNQGVAYVYTRSGTTWTLKAQLAASDGAPGDLFGSAVAVYEDIVAIGSMYQNADPTNQSGAIYIFSKPAGGWAPVPEIAKLRASDAQLNDAFGSRIALDGGLLAAGNDTFGLNDQGAVYIYVRPSNGWQSGTETQRLAAFYGSADDRFGSSIGVSGNTVVAGARNDTVNTIPGMGSGYVYGMADHQLFLPCVRRNE